MLNENPNLSLQRPEFRFPTVLSGSAQILQAEHPPKN